MTDPREGAEASLPTRRFRLGRGKAVTTKDSKDDSFVPTTDKNTRQQQEGESQQQQQLQYTTTAADADATASRNNTIFTVPKGRKEKMKSFSSSSSNHSSVDDDDDVVAGVSSSTHRRRVRRRNRGSKRPQSQSSSLAAAAPTKNMSKGDSDLLNNVRTATTTETPSSMSAGIKNNNNNLFSFGRPRANSDPGDITPKQRKQQQLQQQQQQQQQIRKSTNEILLPHSAGGGGDWMRKFRRRITPKRRGQGVPLDQSDNADSEIKTPRGVSWHSNNLSSDAESEISMPNDFLYHRRKDSFDSATDSAASMPRPILKSKTATTRTQRPKPKLMDDPTHIAITYKVPGKQNTTTTAATTKQLDNESANAENEWSFDSDSDVSFDAEQLPDALLTSTSNSMSRAPGRRARYSVYHGNSKVKRKLRVRPYHRFPEGRYMTEEEIYADSLKPSQCVVQLKSYVAATSSKSIAKAPLLPEVEMLYGSPSMDGRIGALRAEVLGCVSLPRSKPDIAVYLVCGDCAFCTDVLSGYRSPMWPCETRRAAVFPLHHAYVQLFVGVFDVRVRKNKENDVFCGRVALDIASLRSDTEYDVTLPLRASTFVYDRRKRGVIRLRLSLHWFSERAAVISYFKPAKSISKSSPFVEGQPTIPCADPKTFRNVAVTVYGQDLPGKYSRTAFRASMREFNLYQQNLRIILQYAALDAILYERVPVSLYLFCASMYCCLTGSIHMLPPFIVGYILIRYLDNYNFYVQKTEYNLGYKPMTLLEVFNALLDKPEEPEVNFQPVLIDKKAKRNLQGLHAGDGDDDGEIINLDHREFPFSERDAYPKFTVEHALSPSQSTKGGTYLRSSC